ncbi:hypothetical protein GYMLUDRAFT_59320 [Collybiopsis luxurians FD-317 M1]|uniref:Uncharacterized protein n=1 Tax=Collybiopsis luxurians FD-317 M1 TaxID=944289 RepID=A0A0D0CXJ9_9AGAR|nr:hypothetical protein GYMLUDRAFT_59320 [Collybiopsis luxurians FD-317 M1]
MALPLWAPSLSCSMAQTTPQSWKMPQVWLMHKLMQDSKLQNLSRMGSDRFIERGGPFIFTTSINVILSLRLYALYQSSKIEFQTNSNADVEVLALIVSLMIGEFAMEFWGSYKFLTLETGVPFTDLDALTPFIPEIKHVYPECAYGELPATTLPMGLKLTECEASLHLLFQQSFSASWLTSVSNMLHGDQLLQRRFIEQIKVLGWNCLLLLVSAKTAPAITMLIKTLPVATVLVTLLMVTFQTSAIGFASIPWVVGAYSVAGTKLILNLREAMDIDPTNSEATVRHWHDSRHSSSGLSYFSPSASST